ERAIAAGDRDTGVTIMRVTEGLDSGPIALQASVPIGEDDFGALAGRLQELSGELAVRALELHQAGGLDFVPQDDAAATYAEKIDPSERRLDLGSSALELARMVRALNPHIGAYLELAGGDRLGVREASAQPARGLGRGEVETADGLRIGCRDGALRLEVVQPPGGRPMPAAAYLRGHPPPVPATRTDRNQARGVGADPDSSP
ncbi:MAG: methionyl-tRNA formyltransferase, partial [Solirubrobacterales bacterium]